MHSKCKMSGDKSIIDFIPSTFPISFIICHHVYSMDRLYTPRQIGNCRPALWLGFKEAPPSKSAMPDFGPGH